MRIFLAIFFLVISPACATNLLYGPVIDPKTHQPAIIYLTDVPSHVCPAGWYAIHAVDSKTENRVPMNPMCWQIDDDGRYVIWIPSKSKKFYGADGFMFVPGATAAINAFMVRHTMRLLKERQQEGIEQERAIQSAQPHP